jgi:hypothetical protein
VRLDDDDVESLGLAGGQTAIFAGDTETTSIYDNITLAQARIMTGNIGVEGWQRASGRPTTIARNTFGGDVRIMTGDMSAAAAADFWK